MPNSFPPWCHGHTYCHLPCATDEKTEAQDRGDTCPGSHRARCGARIHTRCDRHQSPAVWTLSPLLCPAQAPQTVQGGCLEGPSRQEFSSAQPCSVTSLSICGPQNPSTPRLGLWGSARPTPGNQHVNWGPEWHRTHPRSHSKSQQSQPLNPGSLLKP